MMPGYAFPWTDVMAEQDRPDILAAIVAHDLEALHATLAGGGDPNQRGPGAEPALSHAAWIAEPAMVTALLRAGAEVDAESDSGNTALMHAAARGHLEVVGLLLAGGADPAHRNKWGLSAGDWAQWPENGDAIAAALGIADA